jgi:quercetin dioxygenase-like cupin family protein
MDRKIWFRGGVVTAAATASLIAAGFAAQAGQDGRQPDRPGQPGQMHMQDPDHIMLNKDDLQWKKGPPSLPDGAQVAMMEGDPSSSGPFTMRVKLPANYKIPAHTHPGIEHVTVISGTFHMGTGRRLDTSSGTALKPGGFAVMQIGTEHYAWVGDEETVIQLHGIGPWGIDYIDPADDPRNNR